LTEHIVHHPVTLNLWFIFFVAFFWDAAVHLNWSHWHQVGLQFPSTG